MAGRYNERELCWAALDRWTFSLQFEAPRPLLRHAAVLLRCGGLDTVASLQLNGSPVGAAANAHRPHAWDVTQLLAEGSNRLDITFDPAPDFAAAQRDAYPYAVPHTQQDLAVPGYNFIRKAARWVLRFCLCAAVSRGAACWITCGSIDSGAPHRSHARPTATLAGTGAPPSPLPASPAGWSWWGTALRC